MIICLLICGNTTILFIHLKRNVCVFQRNVSNILHRLKNSFQIFSIHIYVSLLSRWSLISIIIVLSVFLLLHTYIFIMFFLLMNLQFQILYRNNCSVKVHYKKLPHNSFLFTYVSNFHKRYKQKTTLKKKLGKENFI